MDNIATKILTFVFAAVILVLINPFLVWLLWNWLMPAIFGLTKITFLQSIGLVLLVDILIKSHGVKK